MIFKIVNLKSSENQIENQIENLIYQLCQHIKGERVLSLFFAPLNTCDQSTEFCITTKGICLFFSKKIHNPSPFILGDYRQKYLFVVSKWCSNMYPSHCEVGVVLKEKHWNEEHKCFITPSNDFKKQLTEQDKQNNLQLFSQHNQPVWTMLDFLLIVDQSWVSSQPGPVPNYQQINGLKYNDIAVITQLSIGIKMSEILKEFETVIAHIEQTAKNGYTYYVVKDGICLSFYEDYQNNNNRVYSVGDCTKACTELNGRPYDTLWTHTSKRGIPQLKEKYFLERYGAFVIESQHRCGPLTKNKARHNRKVSIGCGQQPISMQQFLLKINPYSQAIPCGIACNYEPAIVTNSHLLNQNNNNHKIWFLFALCLVLLIGLLVKKIIEYVLV